MMAGLSNISFVYFIGKAVERVHSLQGRRQTFVEHSNFRLGSECGDSQSALSSRCFIAAHMTYRVINELQPNSPNLVKFAEVLCDGLTC